VRVHSESDVALFAIVETATNYRPTQVCHHWHALCSFISRPDAEHGSAPAEGGPAETVMAGALH
jgi:hypothetical protein